LNRSESVLDSQRRLEGIVASAMDAIITINADQRVVLFNPAAEQMFKCSAQHAVGQHINIFIPERFRDSHNGHIRQFSAAGSTNRRMGSLGSISGLRATGEEFPIEASISKVELGDEQLFTVILRDVTERSASEDALVESRRRMEGIVASAMDAIITVDEEQKIMLFNPAAERMFGCPAEAALGSAITRFIPTRYRDGHDEHIRRFHEAGVTNRRMGALGAISGLRASGEEFPIEASISQVTIGGQRLSTVILRDITERRTNEESRTLLAREVDHRAKNALAVAQAMVSLTRAETIEGFVEAVKGRIASLARAHSLLSQSQWRGASLVQVIADELTPYAPEHQLTFTGSPMTLSADSVQSVGLMMHELATNAVKHGALSVANGHVSVSWARVDDGLQIIWTESGGPTVQSPSNSGFGSKLLEQVAARQLNAKLALDWNPNGLKVDLLLPEAALGEDGTAGGHSRAAEIAEEARVRETAPGVVLVVEDEPLVAMELGAELIELGWSVLGPAASLEEAEALLSNGVEPDAAILDINLHGKEVYPLARALRDTGVPFIFCTGYETVDPANGFAEVPVVRKPVSPKAISAMLSQLIERTNRRPVA
jgi:PAS domain S-box-containing protein